MNQKSKQHLVDAKDEIDLLSCAEFIDLLTNSRRLDDEVQRDFYAVAEAIRAFSDQGKKTLSRAQELLAGSTSDSSSAV